MDQRGGDDPVVLTWTFQITGPSFALKVPMTPFLDHEKHRQTLWKMVGTEEEVRLVKDQIEALGASTEVYCEQGDFELRERQYEALTGGFKTEACPQCYWLDLDIVGYCGYLGWPDESVETALEHPKAVSDLNQCPLGKE